MENIHYRQGYKLVEVDTRKATFKGLRWSALGAFGKKKFDNFVFLNNAKNERGMRTKVIYV